MAVTGKQEKTKYKLAESVKECMKTAPVDKITVKNIVEGCGVARQTFYRNFLDKYDLINWYFDKLVLQSFEQIGMGHTVGESLTQKFEFILIEKVFFTEAFRSDDRNSLKEHDFELILQFYTDLIARKTSQPLGQELQFLLEMYCQGSVYMTVKWVLGGMKDTPLEGVAPTKNPSVPIIAVPTTAGTAAEVTINYVITDVEKKRKFVCVDTHDIPVVAVVDPEMMSSMPKGLTAATGMDALTHAIEGYTTKGAWEMTDMFNLKAIEVIARSLRDAVENKPEGREGMALGQYLTGMGFSNCGLGIVHSMAHGLGALYDTPHGVANAIILPTVMEYNAPCTGTKFRDIAIAMGVEGVENMTQEEYRKAAVDAVKKLSADVGIPADLKEIVKPEDVDFLSQSAMDDACRPGNPKDPSFEDIKNLYLSLM